MTVALNELKEMNQGIEISEDDIMTNVVLSSLATYAEGTKIASLWD